MYRRFNLGMLAALALGCTPMAGLHEPARREPEPEPDDSPDAADVERMEEVFPSGEVVDACDIVRDLRRRERPAKKARKAARRRRKRRRGWA